MTTSDDTAEKGSDDTPAENQNDEDTGDKEPDSGFGIKISAIGSMTASEGLEEDMEVSQNDNDKEDFAKDTSEVPTEPTPDDEALEDINSPDQGNLLKSIDNKTVKRLKFRRLQPLSSIFSVTHFL